MHKHLRKALARLDWKDGDPPPVIPLDLFFEGNDEEDSIAQNQWGYGRPTIDTIYKTLKAIASRPEVGAVLVGLHPDWNDDVNAKRWPPAENVHIYATVSASEVAGWVESLKADAVVEGWPYGKHSSVPNLPNGYLVYTVCWD